ncbi:MAG: hypothetical protein IAC51_00645 [bacterium]|uniref:Sulfatase N-terminal domain-containing protein n=1 Tax=Candidatus Aphodosoma intestinipullorum TaxID=2840674 RepID=A0A940IE97_9BACT|nr:hypothetical protein [Candidatus Aphodosoma intestinipullorum]
MKRIVFCTIFISAIISIFAQNATNALHQVIKHLNSDTSKVEIYEYGYMHQGDSIKLLRKTIVSKHNGYLFLVDDNPMANWDHTCRYIWVDSTQIYELKETQPPYLLNWRKVKSLCINDSINFKQHRSMQPLTQTLKSNTLDFLLVNDNKYAVIINGGANLYNNHRRYWNDCSAIFSTLKDIYQYKQENLYVLMSDGTSPSYDRCVNPYTMIFDSSPLDLNNDGVNDIKYSATKSNLKSVFNELSSILTEEDELFVFVTDHGFSSNGHSYINLW